ncbi:uncharacterized protein LOC143585478 [Bidens hawaiensis]|uniref:uncharacterized protein LOC143585478 n=1 Tax=Bidens hawaiensis TaxID=980011 RepID=UPI00404A13DA
MSKSPLSSPALYTLESNDFTVQVPGWKNTQTDKGLCLTLHMPGVLEPKNVDATIDGKHLLIRATTDDDTAVHLAGMELPPNFDKNRDFLAVLKGDGMVKLTLPLVENTQMAANFHTAGRLEYSVASFNISFNDRAYLRQTFSSIIDHVGTKYSSFILYKKVTAESLYIKMSHGLAKMESTSEGLCVSFNMPGLEIEDVRCSLEDDDLFIIEGKKEMGHYIWGIRVPDGL